MLQKGKKIFGKKVDPSQENLCSVDGKVVKAGRRTFSLC